MDGVGRRAPHPEGGGEQVRPGTQVLEKPWEYVESKTYFSWERFFTAVLIEETNGSYLAYAKRKLNPAYLNDFVKDSILEQMTKIQLF